MKKGPILLCVLLWSICLSAQQDISLPGLVVRQNSRVKTGQVEYLSNVSIKATQAAPTLSDGRGQFSLVFSDKPAYNVTRIFAEKSGMEVVNKTDLERAAVVGRLQKLKIVMCPANEMMENQMVYYGIAEEAIVKRFKSRIAKLEAANTGLDNMIAEINKEFNLDLKTKTEAIYALEKEWSEALTSAQETAQKFAAINLDDADSRYLQADAAYKKGDFERVLQLLQYNQLDKNIRNIRSNLSSADSLSAEGRTRMARGQENLRQTIQNALFAARVAKLDGAWNRAEAYYDLAVKGDEEDTEVVFEAARYMQSQNQFSKARTYYEKTLTLTEQPFKRVKILNNLGNLLSNLKEMGKAKQALEEALHISRQLAEKNPNAYLPDVAAILNNMGLLLSATNETGGAKNAFEEALQVSRQLAQQNPEVHLPGLALALNNLGEWLRINNDMVGAKKAYKEALQIFRTLAEKNLNVFLPGVATTLNNLGILSLATNEMGGAKQAYEEALQIRRELAQKNPDVFLPDVAATLNNLGILLSATNEVIGAKKAYEEALQIRRQLAEKNPDIFLPEMGKTLYNIGILLSATNEIIGAKKAYEEALQIVRKLAETNPDYYLQEMIAPLNNLGLLLKATNEIIGAKKAFEEVLHISRQLAQKKPDVFLPHVASTLNNMGALLLAINDMVGAKKAYEEALQISRQLAQTNPDAFLPYVAKTLYSFGILLTSTNDIVSAKKAYEEALQINKQLAQKNPNVFLPYVAKTLYSFGVFLSASNEVAGAKKAYEEALQISRQLTQTNPDAYLQDMAMTLSNLGALLSTNNDIAEAKKAYEEALPIWKQLVKKNPQAFNLEVALTDINLGLIYVQLLKNKGETPLKAAGLELMQDAEQRLAVFPDTHPRVQQYRPYIQQLTKFFKEFDEVAFQLEKQTEPIRALETANQTEKDPQRKVQRQQEILGLLFEIEKTMPGNKEVAKRMAAQYGSLAWYQLFTQQFAEAERSARAGLAKAPGEEWINTNLALALLYQGKWKAAKELYLSLKDKKYSQGTYKDTFLADLAELEQAGISHPDVKKARALLGGK